MAAQKKPWVTNKGERALWEVARWLEAGAPHVNSNGRTLDEFDMLKGIETTSCGTACCIAGALVQFNADPNADHIYWSDILWKAQEISGITNKEDANELFGLDNTGFFGDARRFKNVTPKQAAKVIRYFTRTGVVDWNRVGV